MKMRNIIWIIAIFAMLIFSGCSDSTAGEEATGQVVDDLDSEVDDLDSEVVVEESETDGLEGLSTKEMIEKLSGTESSEETTEIETTEEGSEESESEEDSETTTANEIVIVDLAPSPENLNVKVGDTVTFTSKQKNYKHIIMIVSMDDDTYKQQVGGPFTLLYTDSAEFTFENPGKYLYYSKPAYDQVKGDIVVVE